MVQNSPRQPTKSTMCEGRGRGQDERSSKPRASPRNRENQKEIAGVALTSRLRRRRRRGEDRRQGAAAERSGEGSRRVASLPRVVQWWSSRPRRRPPPPSPPFNRRDALALALSPSFFIVKYENKNKEAEQIGFGFSVRVEDFNADLLYSRSLPFY